MRSRSSLKAMSLPGPKHLGRWVVSFEAFSSTGGRFRSAWGLGISDGDTTNSNYFALNRWADESVQVGLTVKSD
jgi:hypothetical protein